MIDPDRVETMVLDASTVIGYLTPGDAHAEAAREILDADEWVTMAIHPHTLAEILVRPAKEDRLIAVSEALSRIGIERWDPDPDYPQRIAQARAATGLGLADCCPLDAAEQLGAKLATFDARLATVARERGIEVIGIDTGS